MIASLAQHIMTDTEWLFTAAARLGLAAALGGLIGMEREHHGRSAGLRTQMLVAIGAALVMLVSLHFAEVFGGSLSERIRVDPARVAYGVMTGIGFIGAGTIMRHGAGIRGLTTAASLWCTAAVGLASGFGMFLIASVATLLILFTLTFMVKLDAWMPSRVAKKLTLQFPLGQNTHLHDVRNVLTGRGIQIVNYSYAALDEQHVEIIKLDVTLPWQCDLSNLTTIRKDLPALQAFHVD
ncbi:MAG: MgtC/SapB family protein [Phycisphaerae bacterium]